MVPDQEHTINILKCIIKLNDYVPATKKFKFIVKQFDPLEKDNPFIYEYSSFNCAKNSILKSEFKYDNKREIKDGEITLSFSQGKNQEDFKYEVKINSDNINLNQIKSNFYMPIMILIMMVSII